MVFQSGDNIHTAAPREKHKNPGRHFAGILSDPIPPYHTLHTLKHGYPFLDTLLTFKWKRGEETRLGLQVWVWVELYYIYGWRTPKPLELWVVFKFHLGKHIGISRVCPIVK